MVRGGLAPRDIWDWIQGVGLVQGVTRSGLVCDAPSARSADAREARFLVECFIKIQLISWMVQRLYENLRACSWLAAFLLNKLFLAISMSFYLLKCYSEALLNYKTLIELRSKSSTIIFISKLQLKDRKPDVLVHGLGLVNILVFF